MTSKGAQTSGSGRRGLELICEDFCEALGLLQRADFRLDLIYPAEDPKAALLSIEGRRVWLRTFDAPALPQAMPSFEAQFSLTKANSSAALGRAGMVYRDLIPGRLGGRYIGSHITIADGGPVADWVHYHRIAVQLIYVRKGWVRLIYEGQGEPFVMNAGDVVLQPPEIRHRVLESSPGLEVVEVTAPALHETFADHELALPGAGRGDGEYSGQRFLHQRAAEIPWTSYCGGEAQETGMKAASCGLLDARIVRGGGSSSLALRARDCELAFGFVIDGTARLEFGEGFDLGPGDAFVVPPQTAWGLSKIAGNFRLLHVETDRLDAAPQCPL